MNGIFLILRLKNLEHWVTNSYFKSILEKLNNCENISVIDHRKDGGYVTPVEVSGEDKVYVSRIRQDDTVDNGLNLWVVSDNLRKGAALNSVQIAEEIVQKYSKNL